jgi:hypothetical protein
MVKVEFEAKERCHYIVLPNIAVQLEEVKGKFRGEADISEEEIKKYREIGKKAGFSIKKKR